MDYLSLKTAPTGLALDWVTEVKSHLRLDSETERARVESILVPAATAMAEEMTGRQILTATWTLKLDAFPALEAPIELPKAPLQSVTHVKYFDTAGVLQTLSSALYTVEAPDGAFADPGRIVLDYGEVYPGTYGQVRAVEVEFVAGYGEAAAVPPLIKAALLLIVGELFERREDAISGTIITQVPLAARSLLWPFRVWR